jgi:hypothetical protein
MMQVSSYEGGAGRSAFTTIDDLITLSQELLTRLYQIGQYKHPLAVRKGVKPMEKPTKIVRAGAITYFLDIKKTRDNKPFLLITESRYKGNDEKRDRNTIVVFHDNVREFAQAITDLSASMS